MSNETFYATISWDGYIDENDKFLMDNIDDIKKKLHNTKDSVHIMPKELNKNPYGIWNKLLEYAQDDCDYFYQVDVAGQVKTGKMMLLK